MLVRGSALRGVVAFSAIYFLGVVSAAIFGIAVMMQWGNPTWFGIVNVAVLSLALLAPVGPVVLVLTLAVRLTKLSRPVADIAIWTLCLVGMFVFFWNPSLAGYADVREGPIRAEQLIVSASVGGLAGWTYWRLAGCPRPE